MMIETDWITYVLLGSNAVLAAAAALAICRAQRLTAQRRSFWESPNGASLMLQMDPQQLLAAIDARLNDVAEKISQHGEDQPSADADAPPLPYENAVQMAKHGASIDDLTRTCGLSANEARLLMRVHGSGPGGAQAA